jgi:hypothetical protein
MATQVSSGVVDATVKTDLSGVETQLAVQNLRSVINNNSSYIRAVDGIADEFADGTGVSPIPSYDSGDRTGSITVTTTGTLNGGSADRLVNGAITNNSAGSVWFNAQSAAGLIIKFDMGSSVAINEATFYANAAHDQGVWKWQGSSDDSTYTDLGSSFNLGNNQATQVQTELNSNTTAYRYYRLLGVSGTMSSSPYLREMNFQTYGVSVNTTYNATSDYYTTEEVEVIPTMTSNTAPYGTMSAHAVDSGLASYAADKNLGSVWTTPSGNQLGWIAYEATTPSVVTKYKIINHTNAARGLVAWTFEGYNGSGWDVLDTQTNQPTDSLNTVRYYTFVNTTAYAKHRINVSANGGNAYTQVAEIQFYFGGGDMTLISDTFTAETAPTESSAVFLHQPVDAVTLNTDILGYISRDAGTTWTQGTLVDAGSFDSTTNILTMNAVDISSQPSGTSMRYKIVTANTKEQRLHGAWLAWS